MYVVTCRYLYPVHLLQLLHILEMIQEECIYLRSTINLTGIEFFGTVFICLWHAIIANTTFHTTSHAIHAELKHSFSTK